MILQARRIKGDKFTGEDKLEVILNTDNQELFSVLHTIELVSGEDVTHGGGGQAGEYLHYKDAERDANADGIVDYSTVDMLVSQTAKGTSIIKAACEVITLTDMTTFKQEMEAWDNVSEQPVLNKTVLKTGEIILEWAEDNFV